LRTDTGGRSASAVSSNYYASPDNRRVRLDPLDPKTSRHAGQCEFAAETDPAVLRILLKVREGSGGDYWWVECGVCATSWAVPYFESVSA
jgi:hypothetical protein